MKYLLLTLLGFYLCSNQVSAKTDVQLSIQPSNVANIYYQIYGNGKPIYDDLEFVLINPEGKKYEIKTKESILFLKNIPFGNYELILLNKPFTYQLTIDKQYLKKQHVLKRIDLYNDHLSPITSDDSNIKYYLSLLGITSFFILLILYK